MNHSSTTPNHPSCQQKKEKQIPQSPENATILTASTTTTKTNGSKKAPSIHALKDCRSDNNLRLRLQGQNDALRNR